MSAAGIQASFTNSARHIVDEGEFDLTSVGIDIGSSTSHLIFSRLHMEHTGKRFRIVEREVLAESGILLTPYIDGEDIDTEKLREFIDKAYYEAGFKREDIDTGALILTGVAIYRRNARAIADLFAMDSGKFVAVSAGDGLEATMTAYGSGAVELSRKIGGTVMNIDIGGGTSKISICVDGQVQEITAIDVGARLIAMDEASQITRIENAARFFAGEAQINLDYGRELSQVDINTLAGLMADHLIQCIGLEQATPETVKLHRLPTLSYSGQIDVITFSGGVSEFIYENTLESYGDIGFEIAKAIRTRIEGNRISIQKSLATLRATVIGASQYTVQVSGNTIFVHPLEAVPLRNIPVITPRFDLTLDEINPETVATAIDEALTRFDMANTEKGIAIALHWQGSATFKRLDDFCQGLLAGMRELLYQGNPLILVSDGDIGGLLGLHLLEEMKVDNAIVSIDGVDLKEFDFIDIGAFIPSSGAVPVVVKSLAFPATGA